MRRRFDHDLSHEHKTSADMGWLIPISTVEALPGDTFLGNSAALVRLAPMINPVMHRVELRIHHWFVPNRILWFDWENFITGKKDVEVPQVSISGSGSMADYFGIYPEPGLSVSALPFRAYNSIYNEFYRDQDLQEEAPDSSTALRRICWEKDYFTVARPEPQQGEPNFIPFSGSARVSDSGETGPQSDLELNLSAEHYYYASKSGGPGINMSVNFPDVGIDIDEFRRSMALQRFAEARMKYGERYVDYLRYLGVNPSDGRLDRPEYLGGGMQLVHFSEILATAEGENTVVGDMKGHGIASARTNNYRKMFEEHGWVMSLLSVRPKTVYADMCPRKFSRKDVMDFWQRELETLPWQEIKESEIYAGGDETKLFGYAPRFEEYRFEQSFVSRTLRNLDQDWTLSRFFEDPPILNGSFVECTPSDRIFADSNARQMILNISNRIKARRLVSRRASI